MESGGQLWYMKIDPALPKDMELRRIADLEKFRSNNPDHQWPQDHQIGRMREPPSVHSSAFGGGRVRTSSRPVFWNPERMLELLEAMKAYVRKNNLKCVGNDLRKWEAIAKGLPNPLAPSLSKHASSCKNRFCSLRKLHRIPDSGLPAKLERSMDDYFLICRQIEIKPRSERSRLRDDEIGKFCKRQDYAEREAHTGKFCRRRDSAEGEAQDDSGDE